MHTLVCLLLLSVLCRSEFTLPQALSAQFTVTEFQCGNVTLNSTDGDGATRFLTVLHLPTHAQLWSGTTHISAVPFILPQNDTAQVLYCGDRYFAGNDSLVFRATTHTNNHSLSAYINVTVLPVNDAPLTQNATYNVFDNVSLTFNVTGQELDAGDTIQRVTVLQLPHIGELRHTDSQITSVPFQIIGAMAILQFRYDVPVDIPVSSGVLAATFFRFSVTDAQNVTSESAGQVNFDVYTRLHVLNVSVVAIEDTNLQVRLTSASPNTEVLRFSCDSLPEWGTLWLLGPSPFAFQAQHLGVPLINSSGLVLFEPPLDRNGNVTFTYAIHSLTGSRSASATITIQVQAVNDPFTLACQSSLIMPSVTRTLMSGPVITDVDDSSEVYTADIEILSGVNALFSKDLTLYAGAYEEELTLSTGELSGVHHVIMQGPRYAIQEAISFIGVRTGPTTTGSIAVTLTNGLFTNSCSTALLVTTPESEFLSDPTAIHALYATIMLVTLCVCIPCLAHRSCSRNSDVYGYMKAHQRLTARG